MAHLSAPPGFGSNSWGETTWAQANKFINVSFMVADSASWVPAVSTSVNRTINVSTGAAWCCGVYDRTDAVEAISFPANTGSADRWDYLVARWDWSTKTVVFTTIQGVGGGVPVVNPTQALNTSQVNRIPGVRYDAVVCVVKVRPNVTLFQPADLVVDTRVWGGAGSLMTQTTGNFDYLDLPASAIISSTTGIKRAKVGGVWHEIVTKAASSPSDDTGRVNFSLASGWTLGARGVTYRIKSGVCEIRVHAERSSWDGGTRLATIPTAARPAVENWFTSSWAGRPSSEIRVQTNGEMYVTSSGTNGVVCTGLYLMG